MIDETMKINPLLENTNPTGVQTGAPPSDVADEELVRRALAGDEAD